jgi:ribulose-5-phosphate 4-epimerase/fuculose-1-phosphate aldolase
MPTVLPATPAAPDVASSRLQCSAEEWTARVQLAACYRIFAYLGWVELIYNHITLRLPGPDMHFLINPFGLMYAEVRASNLVKIDLQGNVVGHSDWPVNPDGFTVPSAIHAGLTG